MISATATTRGTALVIAASSLCSANPFSKLHGKQEVIRRADFEGFVVTDRVAMFSPGLRVERGRDWCWGDQDGGPGGVGVLLDPSKAGGEGYWQVQWEKTKDINIYRTGADGAYDLQVWI